MKFRNILFSREENFATITINRPEQRNALDINTRMEILKAIQDIKKYNLSLIHI